MSEQTQPEERIDIGSDVLSAEGEKIGSVSYVVVRPPSLHVTDIVVSTGALLGRDVMVPTDRVSAVEGGAVRLDMDRAKLETLPDYVEVNYKNPPPTWAPLGGFAYPAQTTLWPAEMYYPEPSSVKVNAPAGTVGLHEGMDVMSSDGHHVGAVEAVDADPDSDDVVALVIKQGWLFSHDERIPADLVATVENDQVTLSVTKDELQHRVGNG